MDLTVRGHSGLPCGLSGGWNMTLASIVTALVELMVVASVAVLIDGCNGGVCLLVVLIHSASVQVQLDGRKTPRQ
jgi:hypothetical protein